MAPKRKRAQFNSQFRSNSLADNGEPSSSGYETYGRVDPDFGQRSAFPGLDDCDSQQEDGDDDALNYLRMVRSEARSVPTILTAPGHNIAPTEPYSDSSGWNQNGLDGDDRRNTSSDLYTDYDGADVNNTNFEDVYDDYEEGEVEEEEDLDPQEAYYTALLQRFAAFRTSLRNRPSKFDSKTIQSSQHSLSVATAVSVKQEKWSYTLRFCPPTAMHIASLPQAAIMRGLERLSRALSRSALLAPDNQGRILGAWSWALLGACRDRGELGSDEIAYVRMLGKAACRMRGKLRAWSLKRVAPDARNSSSMLSEEDDVEIEQVTEMADNFENLKESDPVKISQPNFGEQITGIADIKPIQRQDNRDGAQEDGAEADANAVQHLQMQPQDDIQPKEPELNEASGGFHHSRNNQKSNEDMVQHDQQRQLNNDAGVTIDETGKAHEDTAQSDPDPGVIEDRIQSELAKRRAYLQKLQESLRPSTGTDMNGANGESPKSVLLGSSAAPTPNQGDDATQDSIQLGLAKKRALSEMTCSQNSDKPEARNTIQPKTSSSNQSQSLPSEDTEPPGSQVHPTVDDEGIIDAYNSEKRAFAMLDIIITIVGEAFGQRDLLDSREVWGEYD